MSEPPWLVLVRALFPPCRRPRLAVRSRGGEEGANSLVPLLWKTLVLAQGPTLKTSTSLVTSQRPVPTQPRCGAGPPRMDLGDALGPRHSATCGFVRRGLVKAEGSRGRRPWVAGRQLAPQGHPVRAQGVPPALGCAHSGNPHLEATGNPSCPGPPRAETCQRSLAQVGSVGRATGPGHATRGCTGASPSPTVPFSRFSSWVSFSLLPEPSPLWASLSRSWEGDTAWLLFFFAPPPPREHGHECWLLL